VLGFAGYILAFLNSVWVVYGIWRSGRRRSQPRPDKRWVRSPP